MAAAAGIGREGAASPTLSEIEEESAALLAAVEARKAQLITQAQQEDEQVNKISRELFGEFGKLRDQLAAAARDLALANANTLVAQSASARLQEEAATAAEAAVAREKSLSDRITVMEKTTLPEAKRAAAAAEAALAQTSELLRKTQTELGQERQESAEIERAHNETRGTLAQIQNTKRAEEAAHRLDLAQAQRKAKDQGVTETTNTLLAFVPTQSGGGGGGGGGSSNPSIPSHGTKTLGELIFGTSYNPQAAGGTGDPVAAKFPQEIATSAHAKIVEHLRKIDTLEVTKQAQKQLIHTQQTTITELEKQVATLTKKNSDNIGRFGEIFGKVRQTSGGDGAAAAAAAASAEAGR